MALILDLSPRLPDQVTGNEIACDGTRGVEFGET
jgi:hypothetical protein